MDYLADASPAPASPDPHPRPIVEPDTALAAVDEVVDDCFFSVGQAIGERKTLDFEAVVWWREHFRTKFLRTLHRHGNTWGEDRHRVTAVAHLLAERAVRHAGERPSIDRACAMKAAGDVEAYCALRARGRRRRAPAQADCGSALHAGYWCLP